MNLVCTVQGCRIGPILFLGVLGFVVVHRCRGRSSSELFTSVGF